MHVINAASATISLSNLPCDLGDQAMLRQGSKPGFGTALLGATTNHGTEFT